MELSLDLGPVFIPKTVDQCLKEVSKLKDVNQKLSKLDDLVNRLEDERRKIDGFRRELPLCFLLLTDAVLKLKEEALEVKRNCCGEEDEEGKKEKKKSWMESVQLWKNGDSTTTCKSEQKQRSEEEDNRSTCENPIKKGSSTVRKEEEKEVVSQATELSLMTPFAAPEQVKVHHSNHSISVKPRLGLGHQQYNKKQRRCWAPELHRLFVDVLAELGGPHVATPKQIRERMQVEGLTNDEVKSHLQKYRLHIRKHSASPTTLAKYGGNCNEASNDVNLPQSNNEGDERSESHDSSKANV